VSCAVAVPCAEGEEPLEAVWLNGSGEIPKDGGLMMYRPTSAEETADRTPSRFRIALRHISGVHPSPHVALLSRDPETGKIRDVLDGVTLERALDGSWATPWMTVVADEEDRDAPWLRGEALLSRLGDVVELRFRAGAGRPRFSHRTVGTRSKDGGELAILALNVRATVLRTAVGGPPSVGGDARGAVRVIEDQLDVLDGVLAQCHVKVRPRKEPMIAIADPPGPALVHIGGMYGLAASGGEIRLAVDGRKIEPLCSERGAKPQDTARRLSEALMARGFETTVALNAHTGREAYPTSDVVVRRKDGSLAAVGPWAKGVAISSDSSQPVEIAAVDLSDGLDAYGAEEIGLGTLEERALLRAFGSPEKGIDFFVVGRFSDGAKQGESFLANGAIGPAVILDGRGIARARQAYALAHEVAHVLLGDPGHPDDSGDGRTWLLMNSRSASARFGPKRITAEECGIIRDNASGLLEPLD